MGEIIPFPSAHPAAGPLGCRCPLTVDRRFLVQPNCPIHGTRTQVAVEQRSTGPHSVAIKVTPLEAA